MSVFGAQITLNTFLFLSLFFDRFLARNFDVWYFKIVVFAWKVLHKSIVHEHRFKRIPEWIFSVFQRHWEPFV